MLTYILTQTRGGQDLVINMEYPVFGELEPGVRFLYDDKLVKYIEANFSHKRRGNLIYITATALMQLAYLNRRAILVKASRFLTITKQYQVFGTTDKILFWKKLITSLLVGASPLLWDWDTANSKKLAILRYF